MDSAVEMEIASQNIIADPRNVANGVRRKDGERSTFLKRLGMTNKNLYDEYLQFKKKNNGKPIVGTKSKKKYITPTKYKKSRNKVEQSRQFSRKELMENVTDALQKSSSLEPLSTNSVVINTERTLYAKSTPEISENNVFPQMKKPVMHYLRAQNDPVASSTPLSNTRPLILNKHPNVPLPSSNPSLSNTVSKKITKPSNKTYINAKDQILTSVPVLNNSPANDDMNPMVKLKRLHVTEPEPVDIEGIASRGKRNLSKYSSKKTKKRVVLDFSPIISPKSGENSSYQSNCLIDNSPLSTTILTDPVKQNLLMQPKTFGNMKTKSITSVNGGFNVSNIDNKSNESKSVVSRTSKKTFRDKATMVNDKKQFMNMTKRLARIKKKNEMLQIKNKILQKQLNERKKPLYEQVDKIEEMKKGGNTQAVFLMEQINNFDKKMVKFSFENMTIFTVLLKRSQKGYQFLQHHNILGMPSTSTVRRFINKDGNFQEKYIDEHIND